MTFHMVPSYLLAGADYFEDRLAGIAVVDKCLLDIRQTLDLMPKPWERSGGGPMRRIRDLAYNEALKVRAFTQFSGTIRRSRLRCYRASSRRRWSGGSGRGCSASAHSPPPDPVRHRQFVQEDRGPLPRMQKGQSRHDGADHLPQVFCRNLLLDAELQERMTALDALRKGKLLAKKRTLHTHSSVLSFGSQATKICPRRR